MGVIKGGFDWGGKQPTKNHCIERTHLRQTRNKLSGRRHGLGRFFPSDMTKEIMADPSVILMNGCCLGWLVAQLHSLVFINEFCYLHFGVGNLSDHLVCVSLKNEGNVAIPWKTCSMAGFRIQNKLFRVLPRNDVASIQTLSWEKPGLPPAYRPNMDGPNMLQPDRSFATRLPPFSQL